MSVKTKAQRQNLFIIICVVGISFGVLQRINNR